MDSGCDDKMLTFTIQKYAAAAMMLAQTAQAAIITTNRRIHERRIDEPVENIKRVRDTLPHPGRGNTVTGDKLPTLGALLT